MSTGPVYVSGAVEGPTDEAVLTRIVRAAGGSVYRVYGKHGKAELKRALPGYNSAARFQPWVVIVDLNHEANCAPPLLRMLLPDPAPQMRLRIAIREVEAWLIADSERVARFLHIRQSAVPTDPEALTDPKLSLVDLARQSRVRAIREDLVPRPGSGRAVGSAYASRLIEFVNDDVAGWRPNVAARTSESLERCLRAVHSLVRG